MPRKALGAPPLVVGCGRLPSSSSTQPSPPDVSAAPAMRPSIMYAPLRRGMIVRSTTLPAERAEHEDAGGE
jgi:hypothetical protein